MKGRTLLFAIVCACAVIGLSGCWHDFYEPPKKSVNIGGEASSNWEKELDELLKTYVDPTSGYVDYTGLKPQTEKVAGIIKALSAVDLSKSSEEERLAFWINAYNVCMIYNILLKYPDGFQGKTVIDYKDKFFTGTKYDVAGQGVSLDDIENRIIRGKNPIPGVSLKKLEPGIHVALSCAAQSCPPLRNSIWKAETVIANLNKQMGVIVNTKKFFTLDPSGKPKVMQLFNWFFDDFKADGKTVGEYFAQWAKDDKLKQALIKAGNNKDSGYVYIEYNWTLNDQKLLK